MSATSPTRVLLLGGSSEIGLAIVRRLARDVPVRLYLLGRDKARLENVAGELRGEDWGDVEVGLVDAEAPDSHQAAIALAFERMGGFDLAILAVGILGAQEGLDAEPATAAEVMHVNFTGAGSLLMESMRAMRRQGSGTVVVLSSVAAERPRAGNAVYGAAKAGLDSLAQGLADAAGSSGAPRVLVVRPGFVKTRMTEGLDPAPFATTPEAVAEATVRGLSGRAHTVWVPGKLRVVFAVLRHVPRGIYRRLPL
jgi:decaprenylphospho-beta-D-erythro-pentofuranosid-2-ulose 2-reductase